jgi:hypothetical protein
MGRWEHRYLGWDRFPDPSTPIEIEQLFTLESDELAPLRCRSPRSRRYAGDRDRHPDLRLGALDPRPQARSPRPATVTS